MPDATATITIRADLLPLLRRLADDQRSWSARLAFDNDALPGDRARTIASDAFRTAADCAAIVRACDAAVVQAEMAL